MTDTADLHWNTEEEKHKVQRIVEAAAREAERQNIPGFALIVVLDDAEPLLSGAVSHATGEAFLALLQFGPEQLVGTLGRAAKAALAEVEG